MALHKIADSNGKLQRARYILWEKLEYVTDPVHYGDKKCSM